MTTAGSASDLLGDSFADLSDVAESERQWIAPWCAERARGWRDRTEARTVVSGRTDLERRGMVLALIQLYAEVAQLMLEGRWAGSAIGFFGYEDPASRLLRALAGIRMGWTAPQARALAAYASKPGTTTGQGGCSLFAVAARALEQLNDSDLADSAQELVSLRNAADSTWGSAGETERIAAVQRLKQQVWRAGAGSRNRIGRRALDWRDEFGPAARLAVLRVVPEPEAAIALEVLGLFGTGSEPTRSWRTWVGEVGAAQVAEVARPLLSTVLTLEDNPAVINPSQYPILLGPESTITTRGAAWALTMAPEPDDVRLLHDVAVKCASKPTLGDPRPQRAAGLASSAIAALGRFQSAPASAVDALQNIHDNIRNTSVKKQAADAKATLTR
ncbi:hypothetical protein [Nocardioides panacihumi]|uniref:hypothetical protein n=1 Tax=Nocardioides panacihumi TaxID=400774 RepID=UPI0031E06E47